MQTYTMFIETHRGAKDTYLAHARLTEQQVNSFRRSYHELAHSDAGITQIVTVVAEPVPALHTITGLAVEFAGVTPTQP